MSFKITLIADETQDYSQNRETNPSSFYSKSCVKDISGDKLFSTIDGQINIKIPWHFSLFSDKVEIYGKTAISMVKIDKQISSIDDKLLIEILRESYAKLYEIVMGDPLLSYSLTIIQDFSLDSPVAVRDLKVALEYMKNIRS